MRVCLLVVALAVASCTRSSTESPAPAPAAPSSEAVFWKWFSAQEEPLADTAVKRDPVPVMEEISREVEKIQHGLICELALDKNTAGAKQGLVISADGDRKLFPAVQRVVGAAPSDLKRWKVIAFRPRQNMPELQLGTLEMNGGKLELADYFFRETGRAGGKVDVEVLVKGLTPETKKPLSTGAFLFLDQILGEYDTETRVGNIDVLPLPAKPGPEVKSLPELAKVVDALKQP